VSVIADSINNGHQVWLRVAGSLAKYLKPIMRAFQILWVYYGLLIASRPVIVWNVIAVLINFLTVDGYAYYLRKEKLARAAGASKS
jgi:hypothetical protein